MAHTHTPLREATTESGEGTAETQNVPHKGWAALLTFMALLAYVVSATNALTFGTAFSGYLMEERASSTKVSWIYNMLNVASCLGSCLGAPLVEELGWRNVLFVSGLLMSLGWVLSAFTPTPDFLFFSYSLLAGLVYRVTCFTSVHVAVCYSPEYPGLTNSIVTSGSGIGLLMSAPFTAYLNDEYSFRGTALILAALNLHICLAAMVFHPLQWHTSRPYAQFDGDRDHGKASSHSSGKARTARASLCSVLTKTLDIFRLFRSPHAVLLALQVCFNLGIFLNTWTMVPFVMSDQGYFVEEVTYCMTVSAVANLVARVVLAVIAIWLKQKSHILYIVASLLSTATLIAFSIEGNLQWRTLCLALCGFGFGVTSTLNTLIIIEIMGTDLLLPVLGVCGILSALFHLTLGPLIGVIIDASQSSTNGLYFLAGLQLLATCIWVFLPLADAVSERKYKYTTLGHEHEHHDQQQQQQQQPIPQFKLENSSLLNSVTATRPVGYDSVVH